MKTAVKLSVIVEAPYEWQVRDALAAAGAGAIGNYDHCQFVVRGEAQFRPLPGSDPAFGDTCEIEKVESVQIQSWCEPERLEEVLAAIRAAHPDEEPAIECSPLEIR